MRKSVIALEIKPQSSS